MSVPSHGGITVFLMSMLCATVGGHACSQIVFDQIDADLGIRTTVLEDDRHRRYLVLTDKPNETACTDFIDGECQGEVICEGRGEQGDGTVGGFMRGTVLSNKQIAKSISADPCSLSMCQVNPSNFGMPYVRTMLASLALVPHSHGSSRAKFQATGHSGSLEMTIGSAPAWQLRAQNQGAQLLVIGLGSSTMPLWLRKHMPHATVHVAELVPAVVSAAACFGLDTSDPMLHLHTGDGRTFLQNSVDGQYDGILVDAFDPDSESEYPSRMRTIEFFSLAKRKLAPGGVLSLNLWIEGELELSRRIRKSLYSAFDGDQIWLGRTPEMKAQEVVAAFSDGVARSDNSHKLADAKEWFTSAEFSPANVHTLQSEKPLRDAGVSRAH